MEQILKHPVVIVILLAGVGFSNLINLKLSTDPNARPKSFTSDDGARLEARIQDLEQWKHEHTKWGREQHGRHEANIRELYRHIGHK